MNLTNARALLQKFNFTELFVEELGWSNPSSGRSMPMSVKDVTYGRREVAQLSGVVIMEIMADNGSIPDATARSAIHKEIAKLHHENILIFVDEKRSQSIWYWAKRVERRIVPRTHIYVRGQPGDLILSKLAALAVDFADFDDSGNVPLLEVTDRLKRALDIERVTKKFYGEFQEQHIAFLDLIEGIDDDRDRRWYASVLLNRLMFIYFLQKKFFLDGGDEFYLQHKLEQSKRSGADLYYTHFLNALFFQGFAKSEEKRSAETNALLGKIKYLNGGLFLKHPIEQRWPHIRVPDDAFENLFALFGRYSWNLNDTPGGQDNEINPDVLGYIFEKYINQKAFGAYYTRPEITEYLCERTIHRLILDGVNKVDEPSRLIRTKRDASSTFDSVGDLLLSLDAPLCKKLLHEVLPNLRLLDPACGSAAFLVSAMKTLINVYAAVIGKIEFLNNRELHDWLKKTQKEHKSVAYFIRRSIITNNLFGVDIMEEAVEIAKLRLFLALVASADTVDALEPLPNIEFNIMAGNSLVGLMHVDDAEFDRRHPKDFFRKSYREVLEEKNELIEVYRRAVGRQADELQELRDSIQKRKDSAIPALNDILLAECGHLGIKYEEAIVDEPSRLVQNKTKRDASSTNEAGRLVYRKRALALEDIAALKPFHWGYEFDQILDAGGFDAIITNPPWDVLQADEKEFFQKYDDTVQKKKIDIKEWRSRFADFMKNEDLRHAWLTYASGFGHLISWIKQSVQYQCQRKGKINLYAVFVEQCFNLLRPGGYCGIVIPSGIYTDLGTKQLREMLFGETTVTGLFCIENRKEVFEGVHRSFKFVIMSFEKGGKTERFPAAFMRHDVAELERFPQEGAIEISVPLVRRLAPDSLSVMEFKNPLDVQIAEKMLKFPLLGERLENVWNISLMQEFNMTTDSHLFKTEPGPGRLPLYEGKVFHQFTSSWGMPKYWLDEAESRQALLGKTGDTGQILNYQCYRLAFRDIAASTNERAMIMTILPKRVFCPHTVSLENVNESSLSSSSRLFLLSVCNSYPIDYVLRMRITSHLSFFFIYNLHIPRLTEKDAAFRPIVERAARLICTTPEFDDLAKEIVDEPSRLVQKKTKRDASSTFGVTDPAERAQLRAELDALVAQLYGLTEEEFAYILTTFPLVDESVKQLTLNTYRDLLRFGKLPETQL